MMRMRDGHGQRIRSIGAGDLDAREKAGDHRVDLGLFRGAGADDGFLDQARGIFAYGDAGARGEHQRDAAGLTELERRLRVLVEEDFLGRGAFRRVVGKEGVEHRREMGEAPGERVLGVGLQLAVGKVGEAVAFGADQAVAGGRQRRVEAEDDQPNFSITSSLTS